VTDEADDAARWWRAYQAAEGDREDELRQLAGRGDGHARRQLASWLADRARYAEAAGVIRPLAATGEYDAGLWLDRWLADAGLTGELLQRARAGDDRAWENLASRLASDRRLAELAELAREWAAHRPDLLTAWLARQNDVSVHRIGAGLGDPESRRRLAWWLSRMGRTGELRRRARAGDEQARERLATGPGERCPRRRTGAG